MGKKKTTTKGTASIAAPKADVNKTDEIKKALARTPHKQPREISAELTAKGIDVSPQYVSTVKSNLKKAEAEGSAASRAETPAVKLKAVKAKRTVKKKKAGRKKRAAGKAAPQAAQAVGISYDQLQQAKELAQHMGGLDKAREALSALANLQE